ncbi:MAG: hypothetical protein SF066_00355 [Thermoanaerobaculia bacterium]|nr:hypothetical protein [Thermoanaerobaculia bacterium]
MRFALLLISALTLTLFALCELVFAYPVARFLYVSLAVVAAAALVRPVAVRRQKGPLAALVILLAALATLHLVDWTTRKPFLRDLARVRVGMTEAEIHPILSRYRRFATKPDTLAAQGETLIVRHSTAGAFDSDVGIVRLSNGRVASVEFSAD